MPFSVKIMPNHSKPSLSGPKVVVLAYDGLCTFEFGIAYEIFGLARPEMGRNWYRYATCAIDRGRLRAAGGLSVEVEGGINTLSTADLIVIPGWRAIDAPVPDRLTHALKRAYARGARVMSLCSGIAVLAASGFLDGRRATTHWRYAETIRKLHPKIILEPDVLYVDGGNVLTAAGSAAGIDLCLHVVRKDFGSAAANSVARRLVVQPHRDGGQMQFIHRPVARDRNGQRLGSLLDWMQENLAKPQPLRRLADRSGMSVRTFQRRFVETTGLPPGEWLLVERVRHAQELLENDVRASLADIALACGFGSLETLRHHFRQRTGISPTAYRARFAGA